jgi:hypothetical protein
MKRPFAVAVATLVGALVLPLATLGPPAGVSSSTLSGQLLSVSQVPTGWSAASSAGDNGVGCMENLLEPAGTKQTPKAQAYFVGPDLLAVFDEKLATYSSATKTYRKIIATMTACKVVNAINKGHVVTGTAGAMSFPRYANASEAFALRLTSLGVTLRCDYLLVRQGSVVAGILEGNWPGVSTTQCKGLVVKALARMK